MEHGARWDLDPKHLLKTQRLGAELRVVVFELAAASLLKLNREQRTIRMLLDDIAFAREPEAIGEDWKRTQEGSAFGDLVTWKIGVFVNDVATNGVFIGGAPALNDLQRSPARAIQEIVQQRQRQ